MSKIMREVRERALGMSKCVRDVRKKAIGVSNSVEELIKKALVKLLGCQRVLLMKGGERFV
jgi:hypothetical protein